MRRIHSSNGTCCNSSNSSAPKASPPSSDSAVAVHLFEQHDEAYHIWAEAGARARPLARSLPATPDRLTVQLLGRRIEIAALDELPRGLGPVLLDLDTDFLIQPGDA